MRDASLAADAAGSYDARGAAAAAAAASSAMASFSSIPPAGGGDLEAETSRRRSPRAFGMHVADTPTRSRRMRMPGLLLLLFNVHELFVAMS